MRTSNLALSFSVASAILGLSGAQFCIEDIEDIYTAESTVTDTSQRRQYVLCPRRIFEIGTLNHNFELQGTNVHPPLPIRPNMTILCGDTGSRENLCWIANGDLQVDATPYRGISDASVEGVQLTGLVFIGARKYSTWGVKPGDITFTNCEWREHTKSVVPIMLDWFDGSSSQLSVTFDSCDFVDNRYFGRGSHASLIYANGEQNSLSFVDTKFDGNDMVFNNTLADTNSFIVESLGPVTMERTCFINNLIGVSSVAVFGNGFTSIDNFEQNSTGSLCEFASVFETLEEYDNFSPVCVDPSASSCLAGGTSIPTTLPSEAPTPLAPSVPTSDTLTVPTGSPTNSPVPSISPAPTFLGQSPAPTVAPSESEPPVAFVFPTAPPENGTGGSGSSDMPQGLVQSIAMGMTGALLLLT